MYDGIDVSKWPAGVTEGLVYTDGSYANETAAKARFPNAQFQTISAAGQIPAMWIDCEPGCVWPPNQAADLFRAWQPQGCKGIYCEESEKAGVLQACLSIGVTPQIFGADWTGVEHIVPGEAETQFESTASYDVSAIPDPAVTTTTTDPPVSSEVEMLFSVASGPTAGNVQTDTQWLVFGNGTKYQILEASDGANLQAKLGVTPLSCAFLANIPPMP